MLAIIGGSLAISVFETKDQAEASAATVSRCQMLLLASKIEVCEVIATGEVGWARSSVAPFAGSAAHSGPSDADC